MKDNNMYRADQKILSLVEAAAVERDQIQNIQETRVLPTRRLEADW